MVALCEIYKVFASEQIGLRDGFFRVVMCIPSSRLLHLFRLPDLEKVTEEKSDPREQEKLDRDTQHRTNETISIRAPIAISKESFSSILKEGKAIRVDEFIHKELKPMEEKESASDKVYRINKILLSPLVDPETLFSMLEGGRYNETIVERARSAISLGELGKWNEKKDNGENESAPVQEVSLESVKLKTRRLMSRYFACGMDLEMACTSRYSNCGRTDKEKRNVQKKLGRPNRITKTKHSLNRQGVNSAPYAEMVIRFWKLLSAEEKKHSHAKLYKDFRARFGVKNVERLADGTLIKTEVEEEEFITAGQFSYIIKREIGKVEIEKAKVSGRYLQRHRPILSDARHRIRFPGQVYIIDSTIADVYLVAAYDRRLLIGRPVIYLVIDAFSSLIVSLHVTLEGPNFRETEIALGRALRSKGAWLEHLGLSGLIEFFPQACKFTSLFSDRGESHSKRGREMAKSHSYIGSIAPAYRPDLKSLVERPFGVANQQLIHWLPGAVRERARERGSRDVRFDAVLTLWEFTRLFALDCAEWNAYKDMSKHVTAPMLQAGLEASPLNFWTWGLENCHASPTFYSKEESIARFTEMLPVTVSREGIFHKDLRYVADWMEEHPAITGSGLGIQTQASMFRDPDNPLIGYCKFPNENILRPMELVFDKNFKDPYTFEDIIDFNALNILNSDERKCTSSSDMDAFRRLRDEIVLEAAAATKTAQADQPLTKNARKANMKGNRKLEASTVKNGADPEKFSQNEKGKTVAAPSVVNEEMPVSSFDELILKKILDWPDR